MSIIKKLFGSDRSKEFIKLLPQTTLKRFLVKLLILLGLLILFILFVLLCALIPLFAFQNNIFKDMNNNTYLLITFAIAFYGFQLICSFWVFNVSFTLLKKQYFSLPARSVLKHLLIIFLLLFSFFYLVDVFHFLSNKQDMIKALNFFNTPSESSDNSLISWILIIFLWLLVGVGEEIVFRGVLYRYLRKLSPRFVAAIIASLLFTLVHFTTPFTGGIGIFVVGIVYALYYEYKNNLITITLLHFLQDILIASLSTYLAALTVQHFFS